MTLDDSLYNYYHNQDIDSFGAIWDYVSKLINWTRYFDPTATYTVEDFKQEAMIKLWKSMHKWNPHRGCFGAFAVTCILSRIKNLAADLINRANIFDRVGGRKSPGIFSNKFRYDYPSLNPIDEGITGKTFYFRVADNVDSILIYFSLKELLLYELIDFPIRAILDYLISEEDNYYWYSKNMEDSTIKQIADILDISVSEINKILKKKECKIRRLIREGG